MQQLVSASSSTVKFPMLKYKAGSFVLSNPQLQCTHSYHLIRHLRTIFLFLWNSDNINIFHQTFHAPINQVFPAEEDSKKDVEDNCKL